jgi:hypothetical protein
MRLFKEAALPLAFVSAVPPGHDGGASLPRGVIPVPLTRIINQTGYGMQFQVGNPPQKATLEIDTGSDTIGFISPRSNLCLREDAPCNKLGTYDNSTSSTAEVAFPAWGYPDYSSGLISMGTGIFVNDTVRFGDVSLDNLTFGSTDNFNLSVALLKAHEASGIMGLSALCFGRDCSIYPTLVQQLADRKVLKTRAFSIYLGPEEPDAVGHLLLGGIDKAKQGDHLFTIPVNRPWTVEYSSFTVNYPGPKPGKVFPIGPGNETDWDTGAAFWGLPSAVFDAIADVFGIPASVRSQSNGPFRVDCRHRNVVDTTLEVGFPGNATIAIPLGRLVTKIGPQHCVTFILPGIGGGGTAEVATNFGAPFLRNVYATFNLDDLTVSFSQVKYTDKQDIVAIAPPS